MLPGLFAFGGHAVLQVASEGFTQSISKTQPDVPPVDRRWLDLFEDRYGIGSYDTLIQLFRQPCVTFAQIAERFGVTREGVRQWHVRVLPDAPRGHERQRLCGLYHRKRRLLKDRVFRGFYRQVRTQVSAERVTLIPARDGFRARTVRLDGQVVALKSARRSRPSKQFAGADAYVLPKITSQAEFVYYALTPSDYLFVPRSVLSSGATTFLDTRSSEYHGYKNTFAALLSRAQAQQAS